ncbi:MAG: gliding motility-associated C-terminal domain-containing protein, partial [Bacteroidota bacterium]
LSLVPPKITCTDQQLEEVTFSWDTVVGATAYLVETSLGQSETIAATSYTITGLVPEQNISITVTPLGDPPCGNGPSSTASCSALACPNITIAAAAEAQFFCLDLGTQPVVLSASSSGGDMTGVFTWSGPGVFISGDTTFFDPAAAGVGEYDLTVDYVETAGCGASTTLEMSVAAVPTADFTLSANEICQTGLVSVNYQGSAGPNAVFNWDFAGATSFPLVGENYELSWPDGGTRTITLTVAENGCQSSAQAAVSIVEPLATPAPFCSATSLTSTTFEWAVVPGATAYLVSIDEGAAVSQTEATLQVNNLTDGQEVTISVIAVGPAPCGNSEAGTVSCRTDNCPNVSLGLDVMQTSFCTAEGMDISPTPLSLTAEGGFGDGVVIWTGTGVEEVNGQYFFNPTGLAPGEYELTVAYTEVICTYTEALTMVVNATPQASIATSATVICEDASVELTFNGSAGPNAVFDWDFAGATVVTQSSEAYSLNWANEGERLITLTVSENGCSTSTEQLIGVEPTFDPGLQIMDLSVCEGAGDLIELSDLLGGAAPGGRWSAEPGSPTSVDVGTGLLNTASVPAGTYTYLYTIPGNACPDVSSTVEITVQPAPVADAGADQTVTCSMGMVSLSGLNSTGGSALTYEWEGPNPNVPISGNDAPMIDVSQPGTYTLIVTSDIGCSDSDRVDVIADTEVPIPEVEISNISCFSADDGALLVTDVLGGRAPFLYSLNGDEATESTFFTGLEQGEYNLRVVGANGCFSDLFLDISQPDQLRVSIDLPDDQNEYNLGDRVVLTADISGGNIIDTVVWEPDSLQIGEGNTISFLADVTRQISVTVVDEFGCTATDQTTILVRRDDPVYIPTALSPNGDNINDVLFIGADPDRVALVDRFLIFNRWGEIVFENYDFDPNDPAQGWDGYHRGEPLNPAVFVYVAVVEMRDGEERVYKGDVTLIR